MIDNAVGALAQTAINIPERPFSDSAGPSLASEVGLPPPHASAEVNTVGTLKNNMQESEQRAYKLNISSCAHSLKKHFLLMCAAGIAAGVTYYLNGLSSWSAIKTVGLSATNAIICASDFVCALMELQRHSHGEPGLPMAENSVANLVFSLMAMTKSSITTATSVANYVNSFTRGSLMLATLLVNTLLPTTIPQHLKDKNLIVAVVKIVLEYMANLLDPLVKNDGYNAEKHRLRGTGFGEQILKTELKTAEETINYLLGTVSRLTPTNASELAGQAWDYIKEKMPALMEKYLSAQKIEDIEQGNVERDMYDMDVSNMSPEQLVAEINKRLVSGGMNLSPV